MTEKQKPLPSINQPESERVQQQEKLSKEEKEKLQVLEGQNNHHVDESGGA